MDLQILGIPALIYFFTTICVILTIVLVTLRRTNARIRAQQRVLHESEERYRILVNHSHDLIWMLKSEGIFSFVSPSWKTILGYEPSDMVGMNLRSLVHQDDVAGCEDYMLRVLDAGNAFLPGPQYRVKHADGDWRWHESNMAPVFAADGAFLYFVGVSRDITEHKRAEDALRLEHERLEYILKITGTGIDIVDSEFNLHFVDKGWRKVYGDPTGRKCYDYFKGLSEPCPGCGTPKALKTKQLIVTEEVLPHENNRVIEVHSIPFQNAEGQWLVAEFNVDISTHKRTELLLQEKNDEIAAQNAKLEQMNRELIAAKAKAEESDRFKSAFLANMSHEIRTPMNGILGFAELLKEPDLSGGRQKEYISVIEQSGIRMLNIINNIVDISKIEAGLMDLDIDQSNISEQIEYIHTFFKPEAEAKGIDLSFKVFLPAKEATITTDCEKVYAILTNLVKNAIKFTHEGTIEFGCSLKKNSESAELEFYVKDTGTGIPKERQIAIFERFVQADIANKMARQGSGLGLAISKAYVEMLGGKIWFESEEGKGTTFYFTLPANSNLAEKVNAEKEISFQGEKVKSKVKGLKILIAEDDNVSEMFLKRILKTPGNEILVARTGVEAVDACRDNPDIDLILMDIMMPEMDGYDATRQIRQFNKDIVIIAQTAYGLSGDREKAIEAGCSDYIAKPIKQAELLGLIQKYFVK